MRLHAKIISTIRETLSRLPVRTVSGDYQIDTLNDTDIDDNRYVILDNTDDGSFTFIGRCPKGISGFKIWGDAHPMVYLDQEGKPISDEGFFYQSLKAFEDHLFIYMGYHWLAAFYPAGLSFLQFYDRNLYAINVELDQLTDPEKIQDFNDELVEAWGIFTTRGFGVERFDETRAFGMFQMLAMASDDLNVSELHDENHNDLLELVDGNRFYQLQFKNPYFVNAFKDGHYVLGDWSKLECFGDHVDGGIFVSKDGFLGIGECDISFFACRRFLGGWRVRKLDRRSFTVNASWDIQWDSIRTDTAGLTSQRAGTIIGIHMNMCCRDGYESSKNFRDLFEVIHSVKIRPWGSRHE